MPVSWEAFKTNSTSLFLGWFLNTDVSGLDPVEEAMKILRVAQDEGTTLRLIGGLAIRFHCHGPHSMHLRAYHDIDLFGLKKESERIFSVFHELRYLSNDVYNGLYGRTRLQFIDRETGREVDVFLDRFRMGHVLDFTARLQLDAVTIPVTDLLLTKLLIVKLNAKDAKDVVALLEDHQIGYVDDQEILNLNRIAQVSARDWGLCKTLNDNLEIMINFAEMGEFTAIEKRDLTQKLTTIRARVQVQRKTLRWKLRSLLGDKVAWYDEVEVGEGEAY